LLEQELPKASLAEMAKDRLRLATMQARLSYVMLGLLGEKRLTSLGYPDKRTAVGVLHVVLAMARTKVVEENYNCAENCQTSQEESDSEQLSFRILQRKIRVLRANIGRLLCVTVPARYVSVSSVRPFWSLLIVRSKWSDFGWDGKGVEEILDMLSKEEIPAAHPGDPDYESEVAKFEREEAERQVLKDNVEQQLTSQVRPRDELQQEHLRLRSIS